MIDENTSRQVEELYRSDDWAELRWAREHSTPQQIARHLLDPQWRNRDYNALDELVEMTHDADLSSLDEDDLETLAASGLPELRQAVIRYAGTPARLLEDMARTESNTRLLQMLVESGKLSQNAIDLCCWNQTDSRLAASMLPKASDDLLHRLSGRDWWPSRKNAVESGRLDRKDLDDMIKTENHPDVVSALIGTGEFDMDSEAEAIRRVITSPGLLTTYTNPMNRRYSLDLPRREVVRQAARTMLEHAPVGMILSMPDDDDENWRTLIDTAATEYAGELGKDMLGLIAQSEGNTQARTILAGRGFPKAAASNAERTLAASPGADGTYGFNLRLLGRLKDDVDYFLGPSHADKYLWAGSVDAQIAKLREIDGTIRPEDRPEWFTTEWIDQAEREMKDPSDNTGTALDAALSGQYAAFENAVIGYIDAGVAMSDGDEVEDVLDGPETSRPVVAATIEAEQLAFDFDDMPSGLDSRQNRGENYSQTKLGTVSNSGSSHETEENDARKETIRNDGQILPVPGNQEDEVPVHGGASAGTAQGTQEAGDAGVGRLHGPGPEGLRPDDHRVRQPLGQDAPTPQAAGQLGSVVQGTQDGGASGRGDRHQERDRSPLTHIDCLCSIRN